MKKHNEGYAIVLVLVVLVVVCLVAVSILSISLNNLQSQQASIAHMQAQYEAQGKIEQVVAQLVIDQQLSEEKSTQKVFLKKLELLCDSEITPIVEDEDNAGLPNDGCTGEDFTYKFALVSKSGMVTIKCDIILAGKLDVSVQSDNTHICTINNVEARYTAYEITTTEVVAGGGA